MIFSSQRQPELRWFNVTVQELDVGTSKVNHAEVVQVIELLPPRTVSSCLYS